MKSTIHCILLLLLLLAIGGCNSKREKKEAPKESRTLIQIITTKGSIIVELYNETPQHRENFIDIITDGVLDSVLFHRVIENFMIQSGDPDSKKAPPGVPLGNGGLDYRVFPEFHPHLFHKRGALAAARDGNPDRASSSTQFYIVQGKTFNDSTLKVAETRINGWLAEHFAKKEPANQALAIALENAMEENNMTLYSQYRDSLRSIAATYTNFDHYTIPEEHRKVYKTLGGTPHLDQNYTVFGEVIRGMEVVDSIAVVEIGKYNRPVEDVRILSVHIIN